LKKPDHKKVITILFFFALLLAAPAIAQDTTALMAQGDELANQSKWGDAAAKYSEVLKADPDNGIAWFSLSECLLPLKKYDEAADAASNAAKHNFRPLLAKVLLARIAAVRGDRDQALKVLEEIAANPKAPAVRPALASAAEFTSLKDDPKYKEIYASIKPCTKPEYRQFDFWVGDWEVHGPGGELAGTNDVTLEQEGCLIIEHWKSAEGVQTGSSFNYFDIRDQKWHQLYIDNSGNAGAFPAMAGTLQDGKMVLLTDNKNGTFSRWTWYVVKPGAVRQMGEQTTDGGKHWNTTWDSTYVKK
jgi:tetratricopeptide (TPR) repeat protein